MTDFWAHCRYPAPGSLGPRPAYGLYVRHAVGVEIRDLSLGWWPGNASDPCCRPDQRAAVIVEASDKIVFDRLQARVPDFCLGL